MFQPSFGFNSTIIEDEKPKTTFSTFRNKYQVSFRQYNYKPELKSFSVGTKMIFSGKNAAQFYKLIQTQRFDWSIFDFDQDTVSLSRFDLCYLRKTKSTDSSNLEKKFLESYYLNILKKTNQGLVEYKRNKKGLILRISTRKSLYYYRI